MAKKIKVYSPDDDAPLIDARSVTVSALPLMPPMPPVAARSPVAPIMPLKPQHAAALLGIGMPLGIAFAP